MDRRSYRKTIDNTTKICNSYSTEKIDKRPSLQILLQCTSYFIYFSHFEKYIFIFLLYFFFFFFLFEFILF